MVELLVPEEIIQSKILLIRGQKVMIDRDLAELYEVKTHVLNQAVKRNRQRFPPDFMFKLNDDEKNELITNCDRFNNLKHSPTTPNAFTEQGVAMLSSVLNSDRAIAVNIAIMRAFVKLRNMIATHADLARKIEELEKTFGDRLDDHDQHFKGIYELLGQLFAEQEKPKKAMGFRTDY